MSGNFSSGFRLDKPLKPITPSVERRKIFSQAYGHIHPRMQYTHHAQIAVIKLSEKQVMMLMPTEISLAHDVTGNGKSLGKTPPKQVVVTEALQMRVEATYIGLRLRFAPSIHGVTPNFILCGVGSRIKAVSCHN
ncbi:hypothetical protein G6M85_25225 [Agrobacterium tumefaciens]|jgi:hypothetical protein|nr:hypothetical protein [Agrobacterium tumefaciens]NTE68895.1 hypothetical protein [Agrobacterium tumefaciens]